MITHTKRIRVRCNYCGTRISFIIELDIQTISYPNLTTKISPTIHITAENDEIIIIEDVQSLNEIEELDKTDRSKD